MTFATAWTRFEAMTIEHLKRGASTASLREDDAKVHATVEAILADIEARGDAAVRDYSERFEPIRTRELPARAWRDHRATSG
jgi:histidinol dehydrogenase